MNQLEPDDGIYACVCVRVRVPWGEKALRNNDVKSQLKYRKDGKFVFSFHNRVLSSRGSVRIKSPESYTEEVGSSGSGIGLLQCIPHPSRLPPL